MSVDNDSGSGEPISSPPMAASIRKNTIDSMSLSQSELSLPQRRSHPSAASLYASTLTPPGSRSMSPVGRGSPARPFSRGRAGSLLVTQSLADTDAATTPGDPLNLALKAFVPHVAIYASPETDGLVREKGFEQGLWELLRPFGERVPGKVTIRDSNGASRSWEDFSVRFTQFGDNIEPPEGLLEATTNGQPSEQTSSGRRIPDVEAVVSRHLKYAEQSFSNLIQPSTPTTHGLDMDVTSPYYALYLRRLLSGIPMSAHESWSHPVACVIAASSRERAPIETFRRLYHESTNGDRRLPPWIDAEYLRYYVLVHDEENSDISKTMALFDQMKRHLGLHCHLLRIRSSQSAETDDDSIPLPRSDWMTAQEELADIERHEGQEEFEDPTRYMFESDATAIRTFIREMVTQSIIPTMERNISVWNDQVASKRKGFSGRFMSLSKRFTTFGGASRNSTGSSSSNNFHAGGYYTADAPEAIMRKLADYAFMLRDWKLAMSTYELIRSDFGNDKAWKYHAAANEMAALSLLIMPPNMSSKTRLDNIVSMLEQASYSYLTRCSSPYGTLRCMALGLELLRMRGGPAVDESVKWGVRIMESRIVGPVGDALLKERMAVCCATKQGVGSMTFGSWRRRSAFWSVLGAQAWVDQAKYIQAQRCLNEARKMYSSLPSEVGIGAWSLASEYMARLHLQLKDGLAQDGLQDSTALAEDGAEEIEVLEQAEPEALHRANKRMSRRMSLVNPPGGPGGILETAPLKPTVDGQGDEKTAAVVDDGFS
ncbi:hypothetical protein M406DRAFT_288598 [Cryphonectria parasitica EP155]|uniref:TRAPP complex protein TRS85 n=1 Tax=Cryphonectria parasitica (strain ATCC 38755 / EP155) TaxID=660469 RepID=A0A9P4Y6A9_CRYP1|nr:uncharacterized protein M406DRAFT_288598 [Cryphonectria parasitica EP155]KAF3767506.1 hypothetical protein M406DRAFT_288598 [Cryphonectria parasitica EP155]